MQKEERYVFFPIKLNCSLERPTTWPSFQALTSLQDPHSLKAPLPRPPLNQQNLPRLGSARDIRDSAFLSGIHKGWSKWERHDEVWLLAQSLWTLVSLSAAIYPGRQHLGNLRNQNQNPAQLVPFQEWKTHRSASRICWSEENKALSIPKDTRTRIC